MQMVTTQGLERQESTQVMRRRSSVAGVDTGHEEEEQCVRGLAPETQVGLSRYSVTIKLCDSYCLGIGDYQVVQ